MHQEEVQRLPVKDVHEMPVRVTPSDLEWNRAGLSAVSIHKWLPTYWCYSRIMLGTSYRD